MTMRVRDVEGVVVGCRRAWERGGDLTEYRAEPVRGERRREPGQVVAALVALLFVVTAVLDMSPGLLDNAVQLGFGVAGATMSRGPRGARAFLIAGGVAYFLLWQFGAVIDPSLVPFHTGNIAVHLSFVASMIGLAVLSGGVPAPVTAGPEAAFREVSVRFVRRRRAPSRPPGRDDRKSAARLAARRLRILAYRG